MITIDIETSIEFIKKQNLQSKSVHKGLGTTKVMFLLSTAPPNMAFTKENDKFIINTRVFSCAARSARARSIALRSISIHVLDCSLFFKFLAARHLMMMLGFSVHVANAQTQSVHSNASALDHTICAIDRTARETLISFCAYFPPFNCILMSMTYNTLKHQKLIKTLENNTAKSLTNISLGAQICNIWLSSNTPKLTFC
jgi:hypothetical protein